MVKFWMDRDQIVGPIDAYLQERSDRISEINEAKEKAERAKDEYFKVSYAERSYIHSRSHLLRGDDIVTAGEAIKLKESALNAHDGKVLCEHSTIMFLNRLTSAVDDEISMYVSSAEGWEGYVKFLKEMTSHATAPQPDRTVEFEKPEEPGLEWTTIVVGIAFLTILVVTLVGTSGA